MADIYICQVWTKYCNILVQNPSTSTLDQTKGQYYVVWGQ